MRMKASWNRLELVLQLVALQFDSSCTSMIRYMLASRMFTCDALFSCFSLFLEDSVPLVATPYRDFIAI